MCVCVVLFVLLVQGALGSVVSRPFLVFQGALDVKDTNWLVQLLPYLVHLRHKLVDALLLRCPVMPRALRKTWTAGC